MDNKTLKKYWWQIIAGIIAVMFIFTQFGSKGAEQDIMLGNRKINNYVEVK